MTITPFHTTLIYLAITSTSCTHTCLYPVRVWKQKATFCDSKNSQTADPLLGTERMDGVGKRNTSQIHRQRSNGLWQPHDNVWLILKQYTLFVYIHVVCGVIQPFWLYKRVNYKWYSPRIIERISKSWNDRWTDSQILDYLNETLQRIWQLWNYHSCLIMTPERK